MKIPRLLHFHQKCLVMTLINHNCVVAHIASQRIVLLVTLALEEQLCLDTSENACLKMLANVVFLSHLLVYHATLMYKGNISS
mgnify:FL=1